MISGAYGVALRREVAGTWILSLLFEVRYSRARLDGNEVSPGVKTEHYTAEQYNY